MNKVILIGRLAKDPEVRYGQGESSIAVGRYALAVERRFKKEGEKNVDFISCICFGKAAEFAEKYLRKGMKISVVGHLNTGSYTNKDGYKVYTTDVIVEEHEFVESKSQGGSSQPEPTPHDVGDGFMNIPEGIDEELPFA